MRVELRREVDGPDTRHLWASLDGRGDLVIEGHDLGPATAPVSDDGEYEWRRTIAARHIPAVIALLDGEPDEDVLRVLARWKGERSYELEQRLRESAIPSAVWTWP